MQKFRFIGRVSGSLLALTLALASTQANAACTPLSAGDVLIAGGFNQSLAVIRRAEFFDPNKETFNSECNMNAGRAGAVSVVFPKNAGNSMAGKVLIVGGENDVSTTEVFNPSTGKFWPGPMLPGQAEFTAGVLLNNGKVLIPKGEVDTTAGEYPVRGVTIFGPTTRTFWTLTNRMTKRRMNFTATLISGCGCSADGKVLIAGGFTGKQVGTQFTLPTNTAELYDPVAKTFTPTIGPMHIARATASATALPDSTVLIAGGATSGGQDTATAEIYDPTTGTFTLTTALFSGTGSDMSVARNAHTATLLPDGTVLIAGGDFITTSFNTAEVYDPTTGKFSPTAGSSMSASGRYNHTATLISGSGTPLDGQVLLAGGFDDKTGKPLNTAEIYDPATQSFTPTSQHMLYFHGSPTASLIP